MFFLIRDRLPGPKMAMICEVVEPFSHPRRERCESGRKGNLSGSWPSQDWAARPSSRVNKCALGRHPFQKTDDSDC